MTEITLAWQDYLRQHYQIDHQVFLQLADDVRDSISFAFFWLELPRAEECSAEGHLFYEHYSPYTTSLYRCCLRCTRTEILVTDWEASSFARFFTLLQNVCWAALDYRFWAGENRRCIDQVRKLLA